MMDPVAVGRANDLSRPHPVLEVRKLKKVFQVDGGSKLALDDLDFKVGRGELICLLGRSGCGKSTLLNLLAGFVPLTAGEVLVEGAPITQPGPDRCVVFQEDALFPWLTVEENIAFGLRARRLKQTEMRSEIEHFLTLVGLLEFRHYLPREISGGMKQRVALARVLILKPKVLLMDEPFGALDAQTREEMQGLLLRLWAQLSHTVLFVTHDVGEALLLADRIMVMSAAPGRIRQEMKVNLSRPRDKDHPDFLQLRRELLGAL